MSNNDRYVRTFCLYDIQTFIHLTCETLDSFTSGIIVQSNLKELRNKTAG